MPYSTSISNVFRHRISDAPLFSFWSHFPDDDLDAGRLAEATAAFQRDFDLDFVKTSPNGMYCVEDYGVTIDFADVRNGGVARIVETPFDSADAWHQLPEVDIFGGALGRELSSLRQLREALPDIPIVFTVFSPMTIAAKLSQGRIHSQIREKAGLGAVHAGLFRLAQTTAAYSRAALDAGADGVFFAHQDTGRNVLGYDDFAEFVQPYDLEALLGAQQGRFNVLHIHGDQIRFRDVQEYPVHALNWHNWETRPSIAAGLASSGKCVVGGIDRWAISRNDVAEVTRQITATLESVLDAKDLIIAPSCAIRAGFSTDTMHAVRDFVRSKTNDIALVKDVAG